MFALYSGYCVSATVNDIDRIFMYMNKLYIQWLSFIMINSSLTSHRWLHGSSIS